MSTSTKPDVPGLHETDAQQRTPRDERVDPPKESPTTPARRPEGADDFSVLLHLGLV